MRIAPRRNVMLAVVAAILIAGFLPVQAGADTSVAGTQGTDTSLPATDSVAHAKGRGKFANLNITVNQTKNLNDQAISITWTGTPTTPSNNPASFLGDYLQIFQCWGNDDGTIAADPGPPPEQCEFGYGTSPGLQPSGGGFAAQRIMSAPSWANHDALAAQGYVDTLGFVWRPFRSVDGRTVKVNRGPEDNQFFDHTSTNEIDYAQTQGGGSGQALFEAFTGKQAPGLGCGQSVDQPDGSTLSPKCWLVIVPRGTVQDENVDASGDPVAVDTSPLAPAAWVNRIAIPLEFNSVDTACPSGAAQRIVSGSELAATAANNWKPVLCAQPGSPPYVYQSVGDPVARQQLLGGTAAMAVTSQPLDPSLVDPATPVVYAPMTLSGLVLGFNVERRASIDIPAAEAAAETLLNGTRVAHINLTPRLVAKLLTQSYQSQFPSLSVGTLISGHEWLQHNPSDLSTDQDFLTFNPEFRDLSVSNARTLAAPIIESRISDSTGQLWQWVLADPEARAWLGGAGDNNTPPMNVNPYFSTDAKVDPLGAFGTPPPNTFPKSDPYCYQSPVTVGSPPKPVPPLCLLDETPYALDMGTAAKEARAANDGAKFSPDGTATDPSLYYTAAGPELQGQRDMVSVTDTASAARYGLQAASLSRAGDDGTNRTFVAPDQAGLLAGEKAMVPNPAVPAVLQAVPASAAPGAYPLTVLTYAATLPASLDANARQDYARFVTYAAGDGQTVGFSLGNLLPGYVPLPSDLRRQANAAAATILGGGPGSGTSPPTTPAPKAHPSGGVAIAGSGTALAGGGNSTVTTGSAPPNTGPPSVTLPITTKRTPGSVARTLAQAVGLIRYTLPITLALGVAAAVSWIVDTRRRTIRPNSVKPKFFGLRRLRSPGDP